ncbi:MAG: tetratricopeptide repeat protein [Bacteriovoracia bacterium]
MPKIPAVVESHSLSDMLNEYRYHAGQFIVNLSEILFSGEDVKDFLQSQSTVDLNLVNEGTFQLATFLDPQGRVESYGWLLRSSSYSFLVPPSLLEKTLERLNRFLISEDVEIHSAGERIFTFIIGPSAETFADQDATSGILFGEDAFFQRGPVEKLKELSPEEVELWRGLSGWPSFDGSDFSHEILNNLRLFDLALVPNKGCYPGQETVSKIATRRGAAYSPVLVELQEKAPAGDIYSFEKKIGTAKNCYQWENLFYLSVSLLRDFRVDKMKLHFSIEGKDYLGTVRHFPLLPGDRLHKAEELFYAGTEDFKNNALDKAEDKFRLAIKIDPGFADAYESLGVMLGRLERYQEAIDLMKQLSEVSPKSVLAHTNMSLYLMKMGKIEEAEEQKAQATLKSFQTFGDEARRKEKEAELKERQQSEWAQRESMFRQVLEIDPEDTLANYGLGSIAVEKGQWKEAKLHLEKVLEQDPKYSVAYLALGKALLGLGLTEEAKNIWKEGIKVSAAKGDLMPANQMQQELNILS